MTLVFTIAALPNTSWLGVAPQVVCTVALVANATALSTKETETMTNCDHHCLRAMYKPSI